MNNFFSNNVDYNLFKKALRSTYNEPVVINIMSDDSSLEKPQAEKSEKPVERKNMSSKYQASPFGKFFGPRKQRTEPLDMKDFSSWKNKNFRESEKQVDNTAEEKVTFSFSDYLKSKTRDSMYNDEDKVKADLQKPIDQISVYDDEYSRFSLDSYLNKLEQQSKVDKDFKQTEDLVDTFALSNEVVPTSEQDENFVYGNDVDIEQFAFETPISGEKFSFEREELDKVRTRLDKMEREANNIKEKQTEKVIATNELSEIAKGDDDDDEFSLDKLGFDSEEDKLLTDSKDSKKDSETIGSRKTFFEVNKTDGKAPFGGRKAATGEESKTEEDDSQDLAAFFNEENEKTDSEEIADSENKENVEKSVDEQIGQEEQTQDVSESKLEESQESNEEEKTEISEELNTEETIGVDADEVSEKSEIKHDVGSEVLTKAEFKTITEEIISKFSDMYKTEKSQPEDYNEQVAGEVAVDPAVQGVGQGIVGQGVGDYGVNQPFDPYVDQNIGVVAGYHDQSGQNAILQQQNELQAKMLELIEQNKKNDFDVAEKLRLAEIEKQRVAEEYESRLKELEKTIRQREEDAKQKAYIEKLKNDIKLKKAETEYKVREAKLKESEKHHSNIKFVGAQLRAELKNSINVSNLEMEKLLLECVTKQTKQAQKEKEKQLEVAQEAIDEENQIEENENDEEVVEEQKPTRTRTRARTTRRTSTRRTTARSHSHTRTPRRKIDSDIIGGIDFD